MKQFHLSSEHKILTLSEAEVRREIIILSKSKPGTELDPLVSRSRDRGHQEERNGEQVVIKVMGNSAFPQALILGIND